MKANNIEGFNSGNDDDSDVANQLNRQSLMKEYIIPENVQMSSDGILSFTFNKKIKTLEDPLQSKRILQKESKSYLEMIENYFRLNKSI